MRCAIIVPSHRRGDVRIILRMITLVLLCPPFFGIFEIDPGSPARKNLPVGAFSRSTKVSNFRAHYLKIYGILVTIVTVRIV